MTRLSGSLACFILATCVALPAHGEKALYVNFAPDIRYSANGQDSIISFELEKMLYGYGHDYGKLVPCVNGSTKCISLDFMALYDLPDDAAVGSEYVVGSYRFKVVRTIELSIVGCQRTAYRVDVMKDGQHSNSYLADPKLGVIAIITPNFGNKNIPESIFFLQGRAGVFKKAE